MATCDLCTNQSLGRARYGEQYLYLCRDHYADCEIDIFRWEFTNFGRDIQAD